jgi:ankyrin repeat protein
MSPERSHPPPEPLLALTAVPDISAKIKQMFSQSSNTPPPQFAPPKLDPPLTLTALPVELLYQVADYLDPADLYNLHHTTSRLRAVLASFLQHSLVESHSNSAGLALSWACTTGHLGLVRFLLDHEDSTCENAIPLPSDLISFTNCHNETPLMAAVRGDRECIIRIYHWDDYEPEYASRRAEPLASPEKERREDIVRLLLMRGVNFDKVDENLKSALHYASQYGDSNICRILLSCGADATSFDYGHLTPLHLGAYCNRLDTLRVLLAFESARKTINEGAEDDETALSMAAEAGHKDVVQLLLDYGADLTLCNSTGDSPLHLAAMTGKTEVVGLLLDHGANPMARNEQGLTPRDVAEESMMSNDEVIGLLRDAEQRIINLCRSVTT